MAGSASRPRGRLSAASRMRAGTFRSPGCVAAPGEPGPPRGRRGTAEAGGGASRALCEARPGRAVAGGMSAAGGVGSCGPGGAACGGGVGGAASAPGGGVSMFRWLEVLEKEFDKAFVDVDLLLGEIDPDQADITYEGRQKMTSLSSCFAQLCHKAQTVSQINHKLEVRARRRGAEGPAGSGLSAPGRVRPAVGSSRTARPSGSGLQDSGCPPGDWPGAAQRIPGSGLRCYRVAHGDKKLSLVMKEASQAADATGWPCICIVSRKFDNPYKIGQRHQESSSFQAAVRKLFLSTSEWNNNNNKKMDWG